SKIVLNLSLYPSSRVFEVARVSYALANRKAVVSDIYPESAIDEDLTEAVAFAPINQVHHKCMELLWDDEARRQLANRGFEAIKHRDIRVILAQALINSGLG